MSLSEPAPASDATRLRPLYRMAFALAPRLGFGGVRRMAATLAALMWWTIPSRRKRAIHAVQRHLELPEVQARQIARASFTHNFRSFFELFLVGSVDESFCRYSIRETEPGALEAALRYDGPLVATTGHLGAWELLAGLLGSVVGQYRQDALVVVRRNRNPQLHAVITRFRELRGARVVDHRHAVFRVLKALRRKGVAAFLVDHNSPRKESLFLPFLGEVAAVNMGPALLAVRSHAAVMPIFLLRAGEEGDGQGGPQYVLHVGSLLTPEMLKGTREEKILHVATFYTHQAELAVQSAPDQWFWMHNRWKTQPRGPVTRGVEEG